MVMWKIDIKNKYRMTCRTIRYSELYEIYSKNVSKFSLAEDIFILVQL